MTKEKIEELKKEKKSKCYYDMQSKYHPCAGMIRAFDLDNKIEVPLIFNFAKGTERNGYVAIRAKKGERGLVFNICPFCSMNIVNDKEQINTDKIPYYD